MNACGRPVIAYGAGGALDTVVDGETGTLAQEQTVPSFTAAIEHFERMALEPELSRAHALRFSRRHFVTRMQDIVTHAWEQRQSIDLL